MDIKLTSGKDYLCSGGCGNIVTSYGDKCSDCNKDLND